MKGFQPGEQPWGGLTGTTVGPRPTSFSKAASAGDIHSPFYTAANSLERTLCVLGPSVFPS